MCKRIYQCVDKLSTQPVKNFAFLIALTSSAEENLFAHALSSHHQGRPLSFLYVRTEETRSKRGARSPCYV